jgi:hypothetical protein
MAAMDAEKDYYSILGVVPSIDDVALTAVYRAHEQSNAEHL